MSGIFFPTHNVQAQDDSGNAAKQQVDQLNNQVKDKQSHVDQLNSLINKYHDTIQQQENQQATLQNDIMLLDNRVSQTELNIERIKTQQDLARLQIQALDQQIDDQTKHIGVQKDYAAELIRQINSADNVPAFEILLTKPSLSSFFDRLEETKNLQGKLGDALDKVKDYKKTLQAEKDQQNQKRQALEQEKKDLNKQQMDLESEKNFKISLAAETHLKQSEYERMLYELQQQQQATTDEISNLEESLKDKLDTADQSLSRGDVLLDWPLKPISDITITAHFHDPNYPFRNRFEHPGTDLRCDVGTPVYAAAGGYVAWTKQGSAYGNYLMIVHPYNLATIYAHLTRFAVKPDTYVERGDLVGYSGGKPGMPGAGLSTGPHLHFEVRQNGIPVNAENFLPSLPGDGDN